MILDWLAQTPVLLVALLVFFLPGLLALAGVGLRGLALLAAAPLFSVATTALIAVAFGAVGIDWTPLSWGIGSIFLAGLAWVMGRFLGSRMPQARKSDRRWLLPIALTIGILLGMWRIVTYISDPAGISQTNDAVFHMNAVRFILETADASSLHVNAVIGGHSFYPSAWHGAVSLVATMSGASISVAANISTVVIGAVIWPFGIAWLTRTVTGSGNVASYAVVLSSALQTFPLLMFQWGVLFPNALSTALVPAAVAVVVSLPSWNIASPRWRSIVRSSLFVCVVAAALMLSQPSALVPWGAISVAWLSFWLAGRIATLGRVRTVSLIAISWVALAGAWLYLSRSTSGSHWPPFRGKFESFRDVLFNGQVLIPPAYGVSVLMIVGIVVAFRRPALRWFAVAWVGISGLYLLVAGIDAPFVRNEILGAWYADPYRIAALAPIVVIPIAALGVDAIVLLLSKRLPFAPDGTRANAITVAALTLFMVVLVLLRPVAMPAFLEGSYDRESRYLAADDAFLDPGERTLLESLDVLVEPDARVIGNPSTGTGFGYFLSGVDVYPRTWAPPTTEPWGVLSQDLRDAATEPAVCDALAVYGDPEYVLDFGIGENGPGRYKLPGMTDFAGQDGFELVAEEGDVSLWRITACAQ